MLQSRKRSKSKSLQESAKKRKVLPLIQAGNGMADDHSTVGAFNNSRLILRNHKEELIKLIKHPKTTYVRGCVAWLTDFDVLDALATVPKKEIVTNVSFCDNKYPSENCDGICTEYMHGGTNIIVQKEDFLRPDSDVDLDSWGVTLRQKYKAVGDVEASCAYGDLAKAQDGSNSRTKAKREGEHDQMNYHSSASSERIRCVGNHNSDKKPAFPRMHHKFLLFGGLNLAWIGSFNVTHNSGRSLESVILMSDENIFNALGREFKQIWCSSEPLNWEDKWVSPNHRVGS